MTYKVESFFNIYDIFYDLKTHTIVISALNS